MSVKREIGNNPEQEDQEKSEVSVELTLVCSCHDEEENNYYYEKATTDSEVYSKIARMRHYAPGEEQEERLKGVSTKLTLFLDPWKIKKQLTQSDLGHLCRLLVHTTLIDKYVLPLMSADYIASIKSKKGLKISVWDHDTHSEHNLVLKKWATSKSYVFIEGWSQDFVIRRDLKERDEIGLYWDPYSLKFNFRVLVKV